MPEEKKQDIPLDLQAYQARNPGAFPNPEAFQTAWFEEGYGPSEGLVTFVCHEDTPKGPQYYLAGYPITGYDEEPVVKEGMMLPASPDILNLSPEERDKAAAVLDECIHYGTSYFANYPEGRISDPDIRQFVGEEDRKICTELDILTDTINGKQRYIDKYDEYYRKLANALLDHEDPKFGIERIAASLEQAAYVCHERHLNKTSFHDEEYVVHMLNDVLQERGASKEEQDALAAYEKVFHSKDGDCKNGMAGFFCMSAGTICQHNGLSVRLIKNDFPELPKDAPCYTAQIVEMTKEQDNHCIRQDSADGKYIPLYLTQGLLVTDHVFLDGRPREMNTQSLSARQAALMHCMKDLDLTEKIDWTNPQICVTAASIAALYKEREGMPGRPVSQKNDYPALGDFKVTESGRIESEIPLYIVNQQRAEPQSASEKEKIEKEWLREGEHLGDMDYRIQFSGSLDDARKWMQRNFSISHSQKPFADEFPLPEDKRFLLLNTVKGGEFGLKTQFDYFSIMQNGDSYSFHDVATPMKGEDSPIAGKMTPASKFILDYEQRTGAITLELAQEDDKEPVRHTFVPKDKLDTFIKKHTPIRKGLKKDPGYKEWQSRDEGIPF